MQMFKKSQTNNYGWPTVTPLWPSVTVCDPQWPSVTFCDLLWPSVTHCDPQWPSGTLCVPLWPSVTFCDFCDLLLPPLWPSVTLCDRLWPSLTVCDRLWPSMTLYDRLWPDPLWPGRWCRRRRWGSGCRSAPPPGTCPRPTAQSSPWSGTRAKRNFLDHSENMMGNSLALNLERHRTIEWNATWTVTEEVTVSHAKREQFRSFKIILKTLEFCSLF